MPFNPYWLQRLPEITEKVRTLSAATLDRRTFESIFQLRRRRAIELMHLLGSYRGGRGFVLDRRALLERLESFEIVAQYRWKQQVLSTRSIEQIGQVELNTAAGPSANHRGSSRVVIEFADEKELAEKLSALLRVISDDRHKQIIYEEIGLD